MSTLPTTVAGWPSYVTRAEADAYLAADPVRGEAWRGKTGDARDILLVAAARILDRMDWQGEPADASQPGAWPRTGLKDRNGAPLDGAAVPQAVQDAAMLLAGRIAATPAAADRDRDARTVRRVRAGSAEVEYDTGGGGAAPVPIQDAEAFALVSRWLAGSKGSYASVAGAGGASSFGSSDPYKRTQGFG